MNENIKNLITDIEVQGKELDAVIDDICMEYSAPLDKVMTKIKGLTVEAAGDLQINEVSNAIQEILPFLFFLSVGCEKIGVRSDYAESKRLEKFNIARESTTGTQGDKQAFAEKSTIDEKLVADAYKRGYKSLINRLNLGLSTLDGLKKILTIKGQEMTLERNQASIMG